MAPLVAEIMAAEMGMDEQGSRPVRRYTELAQGYLLVPYNPHNTLELILDNLINNTMEEKFNPCHRRWYDQFRGL